MSHCSQQERSGLLLGGVPFCNEEQKVSVESREYRSTRSPATALSILWTTELGFCHLLAVALKSDLCTCVQQPEQAWGRAAGECLRPGKQARRGHSLPCTTSPSPPTSSLQPPAIQVSRSLGSPGRVVPAPPGMLGSCPKQHAAVQDTRRPRRRSLAIF